MKSMGLVHNKILIKRGKQAVLFNNKDGFGVDKDSLRLVLGVEIHYQGEVYRATTEDFFRYGETYKHPRFEEQLILERKYFRRTQR